MSKPSTMHQHTLKFSLGPSKSLNDTSFSDTVRPRKGKHRLQKDNAPTLLVLAVHTDAPAFQVVGISSLTEWADDAIRSNWGAVVGYFGAKHRAILQGGMVAHSRRRIASWLTLQVAINLVHFWALELAPWLNGMALISKITLDTPR